MRIARHEYNPSLPRRQTRGVRCAWPRDCRLLSLSGCRGRIRTRGSRCEASPSRRLSLPSNKTLNNAETLVAAFPVRAAAASRSEDTGVALYKLALPSLCMPHGAAVAALSPRR